MTPLRAFLVSFVGGLALLVTGHSVFSVAMTDPPAQPMPGARLPTA